jgi:peptide chain release factor 2
MAHINLLKTTVGEWEDLNRRVHDLLDLLELAEAEGDSSLLADITAEAAEVARAVDKLDLRVLLAGDYARNDAIVSIHAGAGGTESQDWAEMLMRMYLRWAEDHGYTTVVIQISPGEEAGIKSADIEIKGPYAYGYLRAERGVHRLVRLSPYDAAHRRHTSFSLVEVMPAIEDEVPEVEIRPEDLRIDTYRSTGAGGQHVNKTESAVRITHLPTGIVVTCQNERSQIQNREIALRVLRARLLERALEEREREQARLKGQHVEAGWGNQIRSYVLHPYTLVKDHRTGYETSNVQAVLDGDLDPFIEAYLRRGLAMEGRIVDATTVTEAVHAS